MKKKNRLVERINENRRKFRNLEFFSPAGFIVALIVLVLGFILVKILFY